MIAVMVAGLVLLAFGKFWAWGIVGAAVIGLIGLFFRQLHSRASFIRFSTDGVTVCYLYREQFFKWSEIAEVRVERKSNPGRQTFDAPLIRVVLFFRNLLHPKGLPTVVLSLTTDEKTEFALPYTYQMPPEKLAELLTEWKEQEQAPAS